MITGGSSAYLAQPTRHGKTEGYWSRLAQGGASAVGRPGILGGSGGQLETGFRGPQACPRCYQCLVLTVPPP